MCIDIEEFENNPDLDDVVSVLLNKEKMELELYVGVYPNSLRAIREELEIIDISDPIEVYICLDFYKRTIKLHKNPDEHDLKLIIEELKQFSLENK